MECPVCLESYDMKGRRPKSLPCGHSICLECVTHPDFERRCPQDRKAFKEDPKTFPDTMAVISILSEDLLPRRSGCWCRDCFRELSGACLDAGHRPCSVREVREEHVPPLLRAATASLALGRALELVGAAERDARKRLDEWRAQARPLDALQGLVGGGPGGVDRAMQVAAAQAVLAPELAEAARLASLRGDCRLALRAEDGAAWEGTVHLGAAADSPWLRLLLQQMQLDGGLRKVDPPSAEGSSSSTPTTTIAGATQADASALELDLSSTKPSSLTPEQILELLDEQKLAKVRALKGLHSHNESRDIFWLLLRKVAPHLKELDLYNASSRHLSVVQSMTTLRKLKVVNIEKQTPYLPTELEDLDVTDLSMEQLRSVQRMPRLRRLRLVLLGKLRRSLQGVKFLPLPSDHCGLEYLQLHVTAPYQELALSLIKSHAGTLRELAIECNSIVDNGDDYQLDNMLDKLHQFGLPALRRIVLERGYALCTSVDTCIEQVKKLQEALPLVEVVCSLEEEHFETVEHD